MFHSTLLTSTPTGMPRRPCVATVTGLGGKKAGFRGCAVHLRLAKPCASHAPGVSVPNNRRLRVAPPKRASPFASAACTAARGRIQSAGIIKKSRRKQRTAPQKHFVEVWLRKTRLQRCYLDLTVINIVSSHERCPRSSEGSGLLTTASSHSLDSVL